jgi:membrane-associated phospholipid phosphatase
MLNLDLAIYSWLRGSAVDYHGMFPLLKSPWVYAFMENNYLMLYPEIFVVTLVVVEKHLDRPYFIGLLFTCYIVGLTVFILYPVLGPCIYPETVHPDYQSSIVSGMCQGIVAEYQAVRRMSSLTGMAYFVALPSLHVAMALLFQAFLFPARCHFWVFLPVNVFLALSTVFLGAHYLIDLPAGILLTLVLLYPGWRQSHPRMSGGRGTVQAETTCEDAMRPPSTPARADPDGSTWNVQQ